MNPNTATEVRLAARPQGAPGLGDFEVAEVPVPEPGEGQVLVRNQYLSLDPYMRGRMSDARSYAEPYEVGRVMTGSAVGEVVASGDDRFKPGDTVLHELGWRTHALLDAGQAWPVDAATAPLSTYLGVLGLTGLTAYVGVNDLAEIKPGDTVYVSAAAGAVGSVFGQLAKLKGAKRVIGSTGSAEKAARVVEDFGFDTAFSYRDGSVLEQLREAAPDGIDVYFDNVGSDHLEAAIDSMNLYGRIVVCGQISQYNSLRPSPAPRNLGLIVAKRFSLRGMLAQDHLARQRDFLAEVAPLVLTGRLKYAETVAEGIESAPQAFLDLMSGANTGKMLVRVG